MMNDEEQVFSRFWKDVLTLCFIAAVLGVILGGVAGVSFVIASRPAFERVEKLFDRLGGSIP